MSNNSKLQRIQNNAIRIIFNLPRYTGVSDLHEKAGLDLLKDRFIKLNRKFFGRAFSNKNPLILDAIKEYFNYYQGRIVKYTTPLCPFREKIKFLLAY